MWLIARVSTTGRDTVATFSKGHQPVGDARFDDVQRLANQHGYEIRTMLGRVDRQEWPLLVIAYKSRRSDGVGRLGGQYMTWPARRTPSGAAKNEQR